MASRTARKGTSRYKIRNCKQYEAGLIQRGSISFWINDDARHWCTNAVESKKNGGPYSKISLCNNALV